MFYFNIISVVHDKVLFNCGCLFVDGDSMWYPCSLHLDQPCAFDRPKPLKPSNIGLIVWLVVAGENGEGYSIVKARTTLRKAQESALEYLALNLRHRESWRQVVASTPRWESGCDYVTIISVPLEA